MTKIVRLTESDLVRLVRKVIKEQTKMTPVPVFINHKQKSKESNAPSRQEVYKYLQACKSNSGIGKIDINRIKSAVTKINNSEKGIGTNEQPIFDVFNELEINGTFTDFCNLYKQFDLMNGGGSFQKLIYDYASGLENIIGKELTGSELDVIYRNIKNLYDKWMSTRK